MPDTLIAPAPETIAAPEETPSLIAEETELVAAVETEAEEEAEETEDALAGLTEEQLKKSAAGRKLLEAFEYRAKQSRDDHEANLRKQLQSDATEAAEAAQFNAARQQAIQVLGGQAHAQLRGIAKAIESGQHIDATGRDLTESWIANAVQNLVPAALTAAQDTERDIAVRHLAERLPDWKPTQDATRRFEASQRSPNIIVRETGKLDYYGTAAYEVAFEAGRQAALREQEADSKVDAKADGVKTAAATRAAVEPKDRPTPVAGSAVPRGYHPKTKLEADRAIEDGRIQLPRGTARAFYNNLVKGLPDS